jgi:glutaminyl-peptide cyclotransferase
MKNDPKFRLLKLTILCLFPLLIFSRCKTDRKEELEKGQEVAGHPPVVVPDFNADSAFIFIQNQVNFGPRIPNSTAHSQAGLYLIDKLKQYSAMVEVQEFQEAAYDGSTLNLKNIIAIFNSDRKKRILLASHWTPGHLPIRKVIIRERLLMGPMMGPVEWVFC